MKTLLITTYLFCYLFLGISSANAREKILIATNDWPPYSTIMEKVIKQVFQEMGEEVELTTYSWKRCESAVESGKVWAAFPYVPTPERAKKFLFSDPLFFSKTKFFYNKQNFPKITLRKLEDLRPYKIGGTLGHFYTETFQKAGLNVEYTTKEIHNLFKLQKNRVDLVPIDEMVGKYLIQEHLKGQSHHFGIIDNPLSQTSLTLIVSPDYPQAKKLLEKFNQALNKIKQKGLYQQIINQYQKE